MNRNTKYEAKQKAKGLKKLTLWVPENAEVEFKQMAEFCVDNRGCIPFMARDLKTGKLKKGI